MSKSQPKKHKPAQFKANNDMTTTTTTTTSEIFSEIMAADKLAPRVEPSQPPLTPTSKENPPLLNSLNGIAYESYGAAQTTLQEQTNYPNFIPKPSNLMEKIVSLERMTRVDNHESIEVQKATLMHVHTDEDYKMTAKPRGQCLIINNVSFDNDILPERKGSDRDAMRFKGIFEQLGFEVTLKRNLTVEKMKHTLKICASLCKSRHDAVSVILLSHGSETGIYGTDTIELDLNQIISYFDNKQCKQLIGKPKIFIIQACRGRSVDFGVRETQTFFSQPETQGFSQQNHSQILTYESPKLVRWGALDKNNHPTRTDVILCFSCLSGFVSNRNEAAGSWLGVALAFHLQNSAHNKHFMEILNMVSRDVRVWTSSEGIKQALEITCIGFDRNLYFNPGLYD